MISSNPFPTSRSPPLHLSLPSTLPLHLPHPSPPLHTTAQYAAHQLDKDAKQWEDNAMVLAARKMAKLMMQMAQFARWATLSSSPLQWNLWIEDTLGDIESVLYSEVVLH